jgi:hypothetical protein
VTQLKAMAPYADDHSANCSRALLRDPAARHHQQFTAHLIESFSQIRMNTSSTAGTSSMQSEQITAKARELWQKAGSPSGRDLEFWLAAEHELAHDREEIAMEQHGDVSPPSSTPSGGETRAPVRDDSQVKAAKKTRRVSAPVK